MMLRIDHELIVDDVIIVFLASGISFSILPRVTILSVYNWGIYLGD
jgi:hypothetical protein